MFEPDPAHRLAGYEALRARYAPVALPTWHRSFVAPSGTHRVEVRGGSVIETFGARYWPGDALGDHLEFALKYDGVDPGFLAALFAVVDPGEVESYVRSRPTGKYSRRIWFLYELLTGRELPLADLTRGNYVDVLDPARYYAIDPARRVRRQRVNDNLLGDGRFCPVVRRTETVEAYAAADLRRRCVEVVGAYPREMLRRALSYLYTRETRSSFEIERARPSAGRTERYVALLTLAERQDFCDKDSLVELQNRTVDPRFRDPDYRTNQNYVGQTVAWGRERIHYVSPPPEAVADLMAGLIDCHRRMEAGAVPPVVHAAAIAYGFVYIHPFEDGNGRIHRFLIHNILARRGFTPEGIMFPVSAAMLEHRADYDASLEAFSRPLLERIEYELDEAGRMTVEGDPTNLYRFIDLTAQTEALYRFIERAIETDLVEELAFLVRYDRTRRAVQEIVDMPDRRIDLVIRCCLQNDGRLSARKRESLFDFLTDDEVARIEAAVAFTPSEEAGPSSGPS